MSIFDEPKIDCHNHVFDPARFPYRADTPYRPAGQELATARQFREVMDAYGVCHALLVGPNSGYGTDNACLLDAIAGSDGRCKGVAVVPNDVGTAELARLKAAGIVGVAFNPDLPRRGLLPRHPGPAGQAGRPRSVPAAPGGGRPAAAFPAAARAVGRAPGRRPLRASGRGGRPAAAGLPGAAGARARRAGQRQAVGLRQVLRAGPPLCRHVALCPGAGGRVRPRCLRLGLGLAVPARRSAHRLRPAADPGPASLPRPRRRRKLLWDTPRRLFGFG